MFLVNCGDGLVRSDETCDDGNDKPNDGCYNCKIEEGWSCPKPAMDDKSICNSTYKTLICCTNDSSYMW